VAASANVNSPSGVGITTTTRTSGTDLVVTRTFDAPPRIVFEAFTSPALVRQWWAPKSRAVELVGCDADVRPGGRWRYVMRHATHGTMAFSGEYREVMPPSRLVYTEMFEPEAVPVEEASAAVVTVTFEDRGGRTLLTSHSRFPSEEVLDMVLATGMEGGMRESMDQLDRLVTTLAAEGRTS
jgi:uncharacterized protein YndB with AHSA1/START domain